MRAEGDKAAARVRAQDAATDWGMTGKTVLFTGASRGMGRFAAIGLAAFWLTGDQGVPVPGWSTSLPSWLGPGTRLKR